MNGLHRTSASAISTYRSCARKWAWAKIEGKKAVPHKSAQLGTDVHKVGELWGVEGIAPDPNTNEGRIILPALAHMPLPGVAEHESKFEIETNVAIYLGFKDMRWWDDEVQRRYVGDLKTTSDFKWALTEEDLSIDEQGVLYAASELIEFPGLDEVWLRWIYMLTKGAAKSRVVEARMTRSHVETEFEKIEETAFEMGEILRSGKRALELAPNVDTCKAYGGCAFADDCNLSPMERMKAKMAQETLADKMRRQKAEREAAEAAKAGGAGVNSPGSTQAAPPKEEPKADPTPVPKAETTSAPRPQTQALPKTESKKTFSKEDAAVLALLEEIEPGAVKSARAAVKAVQRELA